ncbi:MAG: SCP2 sterol-binding domain-containing protein [Deltaproteobacteria bacterium]|nr:SCP2 sterol-binding domain-containing protein [Deltaproteobacteria bacterium]
MTTVREIFDRMPQTFLPEKATGVTAVVQFDITGEGGGQWHADIVNGALAVVEGLHPKPQLTISASAPDYVDISTGKLNGQLAFMTGRLKAKGDLALAMRMQNYFKR